VREREEGEYQRERGRERNFKIEDRMRQTSP
jgi:hypothetical protein